MDGVLARADDDDEVYKKSPANEELKSSSKIIKRSNANKAKPISVLFFSTVFIIGLIGWWNKGEMNLSAESGPGYWLGITGGSMMLALLLYPARKHVRVLRRWGNIRFWFSTHMMMGVVGPLLILFHSDFSTGSANSNLALFCMLIVVLSGFLGRFFYTRVHYGLYGGKASLKELRSELNLSKGHLGDEVTLSIRILAKLHRSEKRLFRKRPALIALLLLPFFSVALVLDSLQIRSQLLNDLKRQSNSNKWGSAIYKVHSDKALADMREYFYLLKKTYGFLLYERLFSLWHLLHLPLFVMLIITGVVHVVVHLY